MAGYTEFMSLLPQLHNYLLWRRLYLVCLLEPLLVLQWEPYGLVHLLLSFYCWVLVAGRWICQRTCITVMWHSQVEYLVNEVRCYEAQIEESEKGQQPSGVEPRTPLAWVASALPLTTNHHPSQSSMYTAQVVLNASVAHPAATQHVPSELR